MLHKGPCILTSCEIRMCRATSTIGCVTESHIWDKMSPFLYHSAVVRVLQRDRVGPPSQLEQDGRRQADCDGVSPGILPLFKGK